MKVNFLFCITFFFLIKSKAGSKKVQQSLKTEQIQVKDQPGRFIF